MTKLAPNYAQNISSMKREKLICKLVISSLTKRPNLLDLT